MNIESLRELFTREAVRPSEYSLDGGVLPNETPSLRFDGEKWKVLFSERGTTTILHEFVDESVACEAMAFEVLRSARWGVGRKCLTPEQSNSYIIAFGRWNGAGSLAAAMDRVRLLNIPVVQSFRLADLWRRKRVRPGAYRGTDGLTNFGRIRKDR